MKIALNKLDYELNLIFVFILQHLNNYTFKYILQNSIF